MILAITGHRPFPKLGGYKIPNPIYTEVICGLQKMLIELKPDKTLSGMALGVDQWAAGVCMSMNIPYNAIIPFIGQESIWPSQAQLDYQALLNGADKVKYLFSGKPTTKQQAGMLLQQRNEWMVDHCDAVLAVWDGTSGGTANCIKY